ncbi:RHS repeat-associated core domain-containing protein, partial [Accumulibacter sp.]|uniref:RHS repeat-associated core domain-containing protein n=1 Tax=Accumulibacter sp. TaxID=2053492 RepID=UPI0025F49BA3
MRSRWHDPALGTWLTRDPAGYADGMCLYRYVRGNPLVYFDPFGMQASWASSIGEIAGGLLDAAMELLGLGPPEAPATDANGEPAPPANAPPSGEKHAAEAIAEVAPAVGELMLATGAAAAGFIPGVGEVMDAGVLAAPDSTMLERGIAAGSLGMNAATAGVAPNVGLPARIFGRAGAKAAEASLDAARAGTRGGEAAAKQAAKEAAGQGAKGGTYKL